MSILIRKPGILTTVQDLGRPGYRGFGINPSGAMDQTAIRVANMIVANEQFMPTLEMHFPAGEIEFENDTAFAVCGADLSATLDGEALPAWSSATAPAGAVLSFSRRRSGQRAYLAVHGGFELDEWLGSSSTNLAAGLGGYSGRKLMQNDRLNCAPSRLERGVTVGPSIRTVDQRARAIRMITGPEFHTLTAVAERKFLTGHFTLTRDCSRMGYRLSGPPLHRLPEIVSACVAFGTIQLLPDGQLIVLMADHQTSGGYPRIGNVIAADLPRLAQAGPGDELAFELVSITQAEQAVVQLETELNFLRVGCRLQTLCLQ